MSNDLQEFDFSKFQAEAIKQLKSGKPLNGKEGILTPLIKMILEAALDGEIESHLKTDSAKNRRNGRTSKIVRTDQSAFELETPRDRNSTFEPEIVKKRQTYLGDALDNKVIALYGLGMSYSDISKHLEELYGIDATLSGVTDKILPVVKQWQARPLEAVYPFVWMDAIHYKTREDGKVVQTASYTILGVNQRGYKEVLGIYMSEAEGANFWLQVLSDLSNRGVKDILIACIDGLKGFPDAINTIFPETEIQLCIIHQIRNSLKYIASKDQKTFLKDLKKVYQAATKALAESKLIELDETWGKKYPIVIKSWKANWDNLSNYFKYPLDIRRIIYTTNVIEGFHRQLRKVTKTKGAFATENALLKLIYLAVQKISEKWTQPLRNWGQTISQLAIFFEGRLLLDIDVKG
ncbi:IS256 family transposase [Candidatus Magnetominusculus xianensis]|uniref:Mutator family transposase n=1 Tax=Candidatus Magnetominusculus xianensis TaxID=1748249 RepID=A0ABR5SAX7_9BACT|nr:IS256 family transposase [Candidatus Magnetominusculus xianensis]KWT73767.1 transposase [Candidatus Magnetominusculus xianensis]